MYLGTNVRVKKSTFCIITVILIIFLIYTYHKSNFGDKRTISLKNLLVSAIQASEIGGMKVIAVHKNPNYVTKSKGKTKEGVNDPVTEADYQSHCAMYHTLAKAYPDIHIISEEKSVKCDDTNITPLQSDIHELDNFLDVNVDSDDITVWIDPLDATKEFTENLLSYVSTMVCIAYKGEPVIGVIHKPFQSKATFWAWVGHGHSNNFKDRPMQTEEDTLPVLIVSRSHAGEVQNASKTAFGQNVKIISAAGAGYKILEVIVGNATAYVHMTAIKKWDICAGHAILSTLGGTMTPLFAPDKITYGAGDSVILTTGLIATMRDHNWYLDKFANV